MERKSLAMNIPLLDLKSEYKVLRRDIQKELGKVFRSQQWILGKTVSDFEKKVANYLGAKYAVGVASGTDALILSLTALALKTKGKEFFDKKDEIITTPFTFIATAEAIMRCGATPVFVDIEPDSYNICPKAIKKAINKNTVGIMPVHLYGLSAKMKEIMAIAKKNKLFVVEDAAQAIGSLVNKKKAGTWGDCGAFSFFPSKNLGAYGDAGAITTNDKNIYEKLLILRNHGQASQYDAKYLGFNSRLDAMQAAILSVKLKKINRFNGLRRKVAKEYTKALKKLDCLIVPDEGKNDYHVYHQYTATISRKRDQLIRYLNKKGIGSRVYYPVALHKMKAFKKAKVSGKLKNTDYVVKHVFSLPIHSFLKDNEIKYVIKTVNNFVEKEL